jgi:LmbE family N-acetylglucosaminyl deacetylase
MKKSEFIPKVALSIHAHPDDQEFTVAGTLAKWTQAGAKVVSVIITSGDAGSNDPEKGAAYKAELSALREAEQSAANAVLGIQETFFLRYPDGELEPTMELRKELTRLIRRFKPEVVVIGDPQTVFYGNGYINHPDHRAAAQAGLYAAFPSAETRLIFTDLLEKGYEPHKVKRIYVHGAEKTDTIVDIAETIDAKVEALKKHVSQLGEWDPAEMIRDWAKGEAKTKNKDKKKKKQIKYGEAFLVMINVEDKEEG